MQKKSKLYYFRRIPPHFQPVPFPDPPVFLESPSDVSGERGGSVTLSCSVDSNPRPEYTWFKNGDFKTVWGGRLNKRKLFAVIMMGRQTRKLLLSFE